MGQGKKVFLFNILFLSYYFTYSQNVDSLQQLFRKEFTDSQKVNIANELVKYFAETNDLSKAERWANLAIEIAQKKGFFKGLAQSRYLLGRMYLVNGNYNKALENNLECLRLRENAAKARDTIATPKQMSALYSNIGMCYLNMAVYDKAIKYNLKSLEIKNKLRDSLGIARSFNNIGNVYEAEGNIKLALNYQLKSLDIMRKLKNVEGISASLNNIGNIYIKQRNYEYALKYHHEALQLRIENKLWLEVGQSYNNIGNIYFETGENNLALKNFLKAEPLIEEAGDLYSLSAVYINLGELYRRKSDYKQALSFLNKAINTSRQAGVKSMEAEAYEAISTLYAKRGNMNEAYLSLRKYLSIHDSIYQAETVKRIAEMQTKYETEQKNTQIEKLKKEKLISDLNFSQKKLQVARQKMITTLAVLGLLTVLIFAVILVKQNKNKTILNEKLKETNKEIAEINKDLRDSITYAKRIQLAILPDENIFNKIFKEHFIFYKPKDIVSGDFYWLEKFENKILIAAVDCTGHGVPGAFISLLASQILKSAVHEKRIWLPGEILNFLNKELTECLHHNIQISNGLQMKDGLDICMVCLDLENNKLFYSGAFNPLWILRNQNIIELKAEKISIGSYDVKNENNFYTQEIDFHSNDSIYLFTDGYADQFGGPKGKKFKYKSLADLIIRVNSNSMLEQRIIYEEAFENWKGKLAQVDDVLLIGLKI